uniref:IS66 family insertion sequence element accessory protein TnpB n=1 Tax=Candidatus Cryptobacteroides bacterium TaxID=3085639 RepID=UPI00402A4D0E
MFSLNDSLRYWLWSSPTDMRKSFYTLSGLVRTKMGKDPLDGSVYVFINARRDRIKLLHMEPGGPVLYTKVLERGELHVPQRLSGPGTKSIEWRELVVMIEGMIVDERHHYRRVRRVQSLQK